MIKNKTLTNSNSKSNHKQSYCKEPFSKKTKPSIFMKTKLILYKIITTVINKKCIKIKFSKKLKEENDKLIIKINGF
jgi:hypothetical protein